RFGNQHGNSNNSPKKCFICNKLGCWSTNHPRSEQKDKRKTYKRYLQDLGQEDTDEKFATFLLDYEGVDVVSDDTEAEEENDPGYDAWFTSQDGNKDGSTEAYTSTQYVTEYGAINGSQVANILADQAYYHAVTHTNAFNVFPTTTKAHDKPEVFYLEDRYLSVFQGIMPDTGAAGVSTGGKPQFQALQQLQPNLALDTSTAGNHGVRFGDNPEQLSIGTANVPTPFGIIAFQIMPTNTPFLMCLRDMERLGIFLNNVKNVLIHDGKEYPIVRKCGHPWYLINDQEHTLAYCHLTEVEIPYTSYGIAIYTLIRWTLSTDITRSMKRRVTRQTRRIQRARE
ncbi:hypothetical protein F4804DRAFT_334941, partial [Jackrogersella minutella]